jgi:hypothetical protein
MSSTQDELWRTLTRVNAVLRDAEIPFALTGGCAVYARGGPPTEHDVDVLVLQEHAQSAVRALVAAGMREAVSPEDWLVKVYDGDRLVDLLFRPHGSPVTREILDSAEELTVGALQVPVQSATEVLASKLLVLGPHRCDFAPLVAIARALREQVDWPELARRTAASPYAEAFLTLVRRLRLTSEPTVEPPPGAEFTETEEWQPASARLHRVLAEDPRTLEQGVQVCVRGRQVRVSGEVASERRRDQIATVLAETVPDLWVINDVRVVPAGEPTKHEELP